MPRNRDAIDISSTICELLGIDPSTPLPPEFRQHRHQDFLERGLIGLSFRDADVAFTVRVEQIPFHRLAPAEPLIIGTVDDLTVRLVDVIVDSRVTVQLDVLDSPRRRLLFEQYTADLEAWAANAGTSDEEPPEMPGAVMVGVAVRITDDLGTDYGRRSAYHGGSGTEWEGGHIFAPAPPAGASRLTLHLQVGEQETLDVPIQLRGHGSRES